MIRLVLLLVLAAAAVFIVRGLVRDHGRGRGDRRLEELRAVFLHGARVARPASVVLEKHSCGGWRFELPLAWKPEALGEVLVFRVGAVGDGRLQVLQRAELGAHGDPSASAEELDGGRILTRRLADLGEGRLQYTWWLRSADGSSAVSFLLESTKADAVEAFRQADVATVDCSVREASLEAV